MYIANRHSSSVQTGIFFCTWFNVGQLWRKIAFSESFLVCTAARQVVSYTGSDYYGQFPAICLKHRVQCVVTVIIGLRCAAYSPRDDNVALFRTVACCWAANTSMLLRHKHMHLLRRLTLTDVELPNQRKDIDFLTLTDYWLALVVSLPSSAAW